MLGLAVDTHRPCHTLGNQVGGLRATIRERLLALSLLAQFRCELLDLRQLVSCTTPPSLGHVVLQLLPSTGDTCLQVPCVGDNKNVE